MYLSEWVWKMFTLNVFHLFFCFLLPKPKDTQVRSPQHLPSMYCVLYKNAARSLLEKSLSTIQAIMFHSKCIWETN